MDSKNLGAADVKLREYWKRNPLAMKHALWPNVHFYDKQVEIIHSVRDNVETIVPAGNMLGKDFVSGFIVLWFFMTHYQAIPRDRNWVRIITTSVKDEHLDVLWAEVGGFMSRSAIPLDYKSGGPLLLTSHELRNAQDLALTGGNAGSYVKGQVCGPTGEGLQGHHGENTLLIIDEASGVSNVAYKMGCTWAKKRLIIGNPHPCTNFFFQGVKAGDLRFDSPLLNV